MSSQGVWYSWGPGGVGRGSWPLASLAGSLLSPTAQARPASHPHGRGPPTASVVPGLSWSGCLPESGLGQGWQPLQFHGRFPEAGQAGKAGGGQGGEQGSGWGAGRDWAGVLPKEVSRGWAGR